MQYQVEVKTEAAQNVIGKCHELTFEQFSRIPEITGNAVRQLNAHLAGLGIEPSGPVIYEYHFHDSPHGPRRKIHVDGSASHGRRGCTASAN